jgi:hypothetical protein
MAAKFEQCRLGSGETLTIESWPLCFEGDRTVLVNALGQIMTKGKGSVVRELTFNVAQGRCAIVETTEADRKNLFFAIRSGNNKPSRMVRYIAAPESNIVSVFLRRQNDGAYKLRVGWVGERGIAEPLFATGEWLPKALDYWGTYWVGHAFNAKRVPYHRFGVTTVCPWEHMVSS